MALINKLIGLIVTVLVLVFLYVWMFVPEQKHDIQDWYYSMTIDCEQMHGEVSNHQRCKISDDCELARGESVRAKKLAAQYGRYCSDH